MKDARYVLLVHEPYAGTGWVFEIFDDLENVAIVRKELCDDFFDLREYVDYVEWAEEVYPLVEEAAEEFARVNGFEPLDRLDGWGVGDLTWKAPLKRVAE